jgi:hypothetical protein
MQKQWHSKASRFLCSKTGFDDPVLAIRSIARSLLGDPAPIPTDLGLVARRLDVARVLEEPLPFDGVLMRKKNALTIKLNSLSHPRRRRFTLAHELAHVLLTNESQGTRRRSFGGSEVERLCDIAASELLMPEGPTRRFFEPGVSPDSVCRFASSFEVSMQAAARRVLDLELTDGTLLLLKREGDGYFSELWKTGPLRLESPVFLEQLDGTSPFAKFTGERIRVCKFGSGTVEVDIQAKRLGSSDSFLVLISPPVSARETVHIR